METAWLAWVQVRTRNRATGWHLRWMGPKRGVSLVLSCEKLEGVYILVGQLPRTILSISLL